MRSVILGLFVLLSGAAFGQTFEPNLIGGRPADPKDFPASVYASMGNSRCTATVVGERTLFIAAHCVSNGGSASFTVGPNRYTAKCTHSPNYRNDNTADWSLCLVDRKVEGIPYEVVNQDASIHSVGQEVLLTGYGCIRQGGGGGNDGIYRIGEAKVIRLPSSSSNDIVTQGKAALCYGDSGGPAFFYLDQEKTKRVLISVNSRGDIKTTSYLSSVSTPKAKQFISDWSSKNSARICGVHADAVGCRDTKPAPQLPEVCKNVSQHLKTYEGCLTSFPVPQRTVCEAAQEAMLTCLNARY